MSDERSEGLQGGEGDRAYRGWRRRLLLQRRSAYTPLKVEKGYTRFGQRGIRHCRRFGIRDSWPCNKNHRGHGQRPIARGLGARVALNGAAAFLRTCPLQLEIRRRSPR